MALATECPKTIAADAALRARFGETRHEVEARNAVARNIRATRP